MIDKTVLWNRVNSGEEYLRTLASSFDTAWSSLYDSYLTNGRSLVLGLSLVHPDHYSHIEGQQAVQGPRQFDAEIAQGNARCYADRLWGDNCNVRINGRICGDHLFPYSLGGPSVATNKMLLCPIHNRMKSADIHVYPWELGEPPWLAQILERVCRLMSRNI